ncbi:MAG TPA: spore germination protein GerW family protein [Acidimicrobiia bacterium]|nr:spore germination protein GerW family protein [Acidimicrobiia bacterium]
MSTSTDDTQAPLSVALSKLDAVRDVLTVKRVFGDAYEVDGVSVIPVAAVRGGGGGGGGEGDAPDSQGSGSGAGLGFGVNVRPVGAFVVKEGTVTWSPSIDTMRIVLGGQLVALAGILVLGRVLTHRRHRR